MNTDIAEKIKQKIAEVEQWKLDAMNGYVDNLGNKELETMSAALNLAYDMELTFLKEILSLLKKGVSAQPADIEGKPEHFAHNLFMRNADVWTSEHDWTISIDPFKKLVNELVAKNLALYEDNKKYGDIASAMSRVSVELIELRKFKDAALKPKEDIEGKTQEENDLIISGLQVGSDNWKDECERLSGLVEFWQKKYYELNPGFQPAKIDNLNPKPKPEESNKLFVWVKTIDENPKISGKEYCIELNQQYYKAIFIIYSNLERWELNSQTIFPQRWAKPITKSEFLDELGEKEVMIQAFDSVRKLFEMRSWIMEGRGSYPYNDDRYKEEVRYLYDQFDDLQKKVWANIKTKTFEYRERIIADYNAKLKPVEKVSDAEIIKMADKFSNETFSDKSSFEFHTQYTSFLAGAKAIREILNNKGSEI